MIKLIKIEVAGPSGLTLSFSDDSAGRWSAETILARDTELTRPLTDPAYFARAFIESGALAWPKAQEFAPWSLHADLAAAGLLSRQAA